MASPSPVAPAAPAATPPAEIRIANIVQGYHAATGRIPAAEKIHDALSISTGQEDAFYWMQHFAPLGNPVVPLSIRQAAAKGDYLSPGKLDPTMPPDVKSLVPYNQQTVTTQTPQELLYGGEATVGPSQQFFAGGPNPQEQSAKQGLLNVVHALTLPTYAQQYQKNVADAALSKWPALKPLGQLLAIPTSTNLQDAMNVGVLKNYLDSRGFSGALTSPSGTPQYIGPLSAPFKNTAKLNNAIRTYVFYHDLAPALSGDLNAETEAGATGMLQSGESVVDYVRNMPGSDEDHKNLVYLWSFTSRPADMPAGAFAEWYHAKYPSLTPAIVQQQLAQKNTNNLSDMSAIPDDVKQAFSYINAKLPRDWQSANSDVGKAANSVVGFMVRPLSDVLQGNIREIGPGAQGKVVGHIKVDGMVPAQFVAQTVNYALSVPERQIAAQVYATLGLYRMANGDEKLNQVISQAASQITQTKVTPGQEFVKAVGLDPVNQNWLAWMGDQASMIAAGSVYDAAGKALVSGALDTDAARAIAGSVGIKTDAQVIASLNAVEDPQLRQFAMRLHYDACSPSESAHWSTLGTNPDDIAVDPRVSAATSSPHWRGPSSPSLASTWKLRAFQSEDAPALQRAFHLSTMDASPVDLTSTSRADIQTFQHLLHHGYEVKDAMAWGAKMTQAMIDDAKAATPAEGEAAPARQFANASKVKADLEQEIADHYRWDEKPSTDNPAGVVRQPSAKFIQAIKDDPLIGLNCEDPARPSFYDEYQHFDQALQKHYSTRFGPNRMYAPTLDENGQVIEGSKAPTPTTRTNQTARLADIDRKITALRRRASLQSEFDVTGATPEWGTATKPNPKGYVLGADQTMRAPAPKENLLAQANPATTEVQFSPDELRAEREDLLLRQKENAKVGESFHSQKTVDSDQPYTDAELWHHIRDSGGIKPDDAYKDSHVTGRENTAAYKGLARKGGQPIDELASDIAANFPHFGIRNADDLREWLDNYKPPAKEASTAERDIYGTKASQDPRICGAEGALCRPEGRYSRVQARRRLQGHRQDRHDPCD